MLEACPILAAFLSDEILPEQLMPGACQLGQAPEAECGMRGQHSKENLWYPTYMLMEMP